MSVPTFSIIMPTYNRESSILNSINAILEQTYENFELIVVDDGSTDNTISILSAIDDKRLKYLTQTNQRCTQARRNGASKATGKYLAFCDSDDIWSKFYLEKLLNVFENSSAEYIFTNYIVEGESRPRIDVSKLDTKEWLDNYAELKEENYEFKDLYTALLQYQPIFTSAQALKHERYKKIGGISEEINNREKNTVLTAEDNHIILRSALNVKSIFIPETLVTLGRQGDNLSNSYLSNLKGGLFILEDLKTKMTLTNAQFSALKEAIKKHRKEIVLQLYYQEKYDEFKSVYKKEPIINLALKSHIHFLLTLLQRS